MNLLVISLLAYTLIREAIFWVTTQRLLNKLMSRNYHEYVSANEIYKPKEGKVNVEVDELGMEATSILGDFRT